MLDYPVVSFYYDRPGSDYYAKSAEVLKESCERFGIEHHIENPALDPEKYDTWRKTTLYKPVFILQKFEELQRPFIWVDADSWFENKPEASFDGVDIAAVCYKKPKRRSVSLGFLWFNYNERVHLFLKWWAVSCNFDDVSHHNAHNNFDYMFIADYSLTRLLLPIGYCYRGERYDGKVYLVTKNHSSGKDKKDKKKKDKKKKDKKDKKK